MHQYIISGSTTSKAFKLKNRDQKELVNLAIYILEHFGLPIDRTDRKLEKTAIFFLACCNVKNKGDLKRVSTLSKGHSLGTKEMIAFVNQYLGENINKGSYDYVKRDALDYLLEAMVVEVVDPTRALISPSRKYQLNQFFAPLVDSVFKDGWEAKCRERLNEVPKLREELERKRGLNKTKVTMYNGQTIELTFGDHNELQKNIIEKFLPYFGYDSKVLYIGDFNNKHLLYDETGLEVLKIPVFKASNLPDVVAYSETKNWLYFIEAVNSSGPISEMRYRDFARMTQKSPADVIYITAFSDRDTFKSHANNIAWETEVWIADRPEHMIHFNGDKFLGPYK